MGHEQLINTIKIFYEKLKPLPNNLHNKAMRLFREYILVGGMPKPVSVYVENREFEKVDNEKQKILELYRNEVTKFAKGYEYKVKSIFDGIPGQLSKHEKKFILSSISKNARMRNYEASFFWLADAKIANIAYGAADPNVGLALNMQQSSLKCYMSDTGLLVSLAFSDNKKTRDSVYRSIFLKEVSINEGMLTENVVAQTLVANGHKLYFYSRSNFNNPKECLEIDFLITKPYTDAANKPRVSPVEVKSARQYGISSLNKFKDLFGKRIGMRYVVHPKQLKVVDDIVYLPLYMAMCL